MLRRLLRLAAEHDHDLLDEAASSGCVLMISRPPAARFRWRPVRPGRSSRRRRSQRRAHAPPADLRWLPSGANTLSMRNGALDRAFAHAQVALGDIVGVVGDRGSASSDRHRHVAHVALEVGAAHLALEALALNGQTGFRARQAGDADALGEVQGRLGILLLGRAGSAWRQARHRRAPAGNRACGRSASRSGRRGCTARHRRRNRRPARARRCRACRRRNHRPGRRA